MSAAPSPDQFAAAQAQVMLWRAGGPALFAVEALGLPKEWDPIKGEGVLPWQWKASNLLVEKRRLSIRSGKGVGKSSFLSWTILWFQACFFPCKVGCTAPTATQMSDVLWAELALWHRRLKERLPALGEKFNWKSDAFEMVEAPKESFAVARTARPEKPEALQGLHSKYTLVIGDEFSGVDDAIVESARGAFSGDHSWAVLASNPTRRTGFFFETHHALREKWGTLQVNAEDVPLVSKDSIEEIAYQYGKDSNYYRIAVQGEFPTAEDDVVIPIELCESATQRDVDIYGPWTWGLDVARFGSDRTVLMKRRDNGTEGKHKAWNGMDTMQTSGRVYAEWLDTPLEKRPTSIFIDLIGIGAGVFDRLQELGLPVVGVNVAEAASADDHYNRLRDELWFRGRKWLEQKHCKLFPDETLIAELSLPKYSVTSSGKLKVEGKDELKKRYPRSPDVADAFLLTFAYAMAYGGKQIFEPEHFTDF
jgi:phage terminase large subunit